MASAASRAWAALRRSAARRAAPRGQATELKDADVLGLGREDGGQALVAAPGALVEVRAQPARERRRRGGREAPRRQIVRRRLGVALELAQRHRQVELQRVDVGHAAGDAGAHRRHRPRNIRLVARLAARHRQVDVRGGCHGTSFIAASYSRAARVLSTVPNASASSRCLSSAASSAGASSSGGAGGLRAPRAGMPAVTAVEHHGTFPATFRNIQTRAPYGIWYCSAILIMNKVLLRYSLVCHDCNYL